MILIGLGSNLTTQELPTSEAVLMQAIEDMTASSINVLQCSDFYETEPVPKSDQPWYVNAVISVETVLDPEALLDVLHSLEYGLGRRRRDRWEARIIDLDLLCYDDQVFPSIDDWRREKEDQDPNKFFLPHPRLHERHFVLQPLAEIAPDWRHPVLGKTVHEFIASKKPDGIVRPLRAFPEK